MSLTPEKKETNKTLNLLRTQRTPKSCCLQPYFKSLLFSSSFGKGENGFKFLNSSMTPSPEQYKNHFSSNPVPLFIKTIGFSLIAAPDTFNSAIVGSKSPIER